MCIDASCVLALFLGDELDDQIEAAWSRYLNQGPILAPPLLWAEVTAGMYKAFRRGRLTSSEAVIALEDLSALPITMVTDWRVYPQAIVIAGRLNLNKAYGAQYLAVADIERCPIVTMDNGQLKNAISLGYEARLLI